MRMRGDYEITAFYGEEDSRKALEEAEKFINKASEVAETLMKKLKNTYSTSEEPKKYCIILA